MNSKHKWWVLPTSLIAALVPTAAVISCKQPSAENSNPLPHKFRNTYVVLDGLGKNGKDSFSDLATQAATEFYGSKPKVLIPKSSSPEDLMAEYASVPTGSIILASGFPHIDAVEKYPEKIEGKDFVLIDGVTNNEKISSIEFEIEEPSYLAGYSLAEYALTQEGFNKLKGDDDQVIVSTFGGEEKDQVTGFMGGFKNGFNDALAKNDANPLFNKVSFFTFNTKEQHFSGSFIAGEAKPLVEKFKQNKVDILLPVAGDQTKDVLDAKMLAIGVDTPQEKTLGSNVLFSILKNIKEAVKEILLHLEKEPNKKHNIFGKLSKNGQQTNLLGISKGTQEITNIYNKLLNDPDILNIVATQNPKFTI